MIPEELTEMLDFEQQVEFNVEKIEKASKQLLKNIGLKTYTLGYKYWITALIISVQFQIMPHCHNNGFKMYDLYSFIGKKYDTTVSRVERAMRYAQKSLDLKKYFGVSYSMSNTALLFLLKEEIIKYLSKGI